MGTQESETDDAEENVYGNEARETLMDDGEISAEENAFMQGYDHADKEEDDSAHDAYEKAFETKRTKRKRAKKEDSDDDEFEEL
jgi:hypothetical protein